MTPEEKAARVKELNPLLEAVNTPEEAATLARDLYKKGTEVDLVAASKLWLAIADVAQKHEQTEQLMTCIVNAEACLAKAGLATDSVIGRIMATSQDLGLDPSVIASILGPET